MAHKAGKDCSMTSAKVRIIECKKKLNKLFKLDSKLIQNLSTKFPLELIINIKQRTAKFYDCVKYKIRIRQKAKLDKLLKSKKPNLEKLNFLNNYVKTNDKSNHTVCSSNWFINLSNVKLTPNDISVLKLDPRFQVTPNKLNIERLIACIESKLRFINKNKAEIEKIRNSLVQVLGKAVIPTPNLTKEQMLALKRLQNNKDIIITNSDKSNKTVVLDKIDYIKKVEDVLSDTEVIQK
jgi:hypothetical protein